MGAIDVIMKSYPNFLEDMQNNRVMKELREHDPSMTNEEFIACAYALILWTRLIMTQTSETLSNVVIPSNSDSPKSSVVSSTPVVVEPSSIKMGLPCGSVNLR